jgi:hypothetical protein
LMVLLQRVYAVAITVWMMLNGYKLWYDEKLWGS